MLIIKNKKIKKGSSILEAVIASALLAISALAFSNLHVANFKLIHSSSKTLKTSMVLADFGEKIRLKGVKQDQATKTAILDRYRLANYSINKSSCGTTPSYVSDCTLNNTDITACSEEDMIAYEIFNSACQIYNTTEEANVQVEECDASVPDNINICIWVSLDSVVRTEAECDADFNNCVIFATRI